MVMIYYNDILKRSLKRVKMVGIAHFEHFLSISLGEKTGAEVLTGQKEIFPGYR